MQWIGQVETRRHPFVDRQPRTAALRFSIFGFSRRRIDLLCSQPREAPQTDHIGAALSRYSPAGGFVYVADRKGRDMASAGELQNCAREWMFAHCGNAGGELQRLTFGDR